MPFVSVPNSGQTLGQTRDQIRNNILDLKNSLANNHIDLDQGADTGKHKFVEIPVSSPSNIAGEGTLFTSTVGGETQLNYLTDGQGKNYQLTRTISASYASFSSNPGWTFLPGGLLMQWGTTTPASNATSQSVTFPVNFTGLPYNIQVTGFRAGSSPGTTDCWVDSASLAISGFKIFNSGGHSFQFMWIAIGK